MLTFHIVMPSLNQGEYIGDAIRSVLAQSNEVGLSLVVVDACSSDQTPEEIAAALKEPNHADTTVICEPDEGQSDAINKGMRMGKADCVGWLNADDFLLPGALAHVARFFESEPDVVAVYGDVDFIDASGSRIGTLHGLPFRYADALWGPGYIPQPATFVRRSAWEAAGGVRHDLHYVMDFDLWLTLAEHGRVAHLPRTLACFRRHGGQKSTRASALMSAERRRVVRDHSRRVMGRAPLPMELEARQLAVRLSRRARRGLRRFSGVPV